VIACRAESHALKKKSLTDIQEYNSRNQPESRCGENLEELHMHAP